MGADVIHSGTFAEGFEVGYRSIKGTSRMLPMVPMAPMTKMNSTTFLMGVRKGIERALGQKISELSA